MRRTRPPRRRLPALVVVIGFVLGLMAACSDDDDGAAPDDSATTSSEATTPTSAIDYTQVSIAPVPGSTTTTVAIGPGTATLGGLVAGPDGPVPGATVRIERLVGESVAAVDVLTGADGAWRIERILGGRYRVRAWLAPDMTMAEPAIFFLEAREQRAVDLRLEVHSGTMVRTVTDPDPPIVGSSTNLGIRLVSRLVDDQGVVHTNPLPGVELDLAGTGNWELESDNPVVTDATGNAAWVITCRAAGPQPLSVVLDGTDARALSIADCVRPEPTTTTSSSTSTSASRDTTSTSSTSTTTTEAD